MSPVITRLSSAAAKPGVRLTISGRGFGAQRGKSIVLFGNFKATSYLRWSATRIVCKVPLVPAGRLLIEARVAKRTSKGRRFTVRLLPIVIPKTTDVLSKATVAGATTTDGIAYAFANTSQTSRLKPGDVIVGEPTAALPEGIFRKVTAVSAAGASVTTKPATLDDAFTSAQFSADHAITQSDATSADIASGVRLLRSRAQRPDLLTFRFTDVSISTPLAVEFGSVKVSGSLTLKETMHVSGAIGWGGLKSFETSETTTVSSDLQVSSGFTGSVGAEKKWPIGKFAGFTVMVGPVPLYFQPEFQIAVGVDGEASAEMQTSVHEQVSGGIGLTYQSKKFTPWSKFTTASSCDPPTISTSCSLKAYAGAELGLKLYDLAGPYIELDGFGELTADPRTTPWWTLSAGLEASLGAQIGGNYGFINWGLDWHVNLVLAQWTLGKATTPAPTPTPTPTPNSTPTGTLTPSPTSSPSSSPTAGWVGQDSGAAQTPLHDIVFVDAAHGWVTDYDDGDIRYTTDGGRTWSLELENIAAPLHLSLPSALCFVDDLHGWVTGGDWSAQNQIIGETSDGGSTWTKLENFYWNTGGPDYEFGHLSFSSTTHGWAVGDDLYSTNPVPTIFSTSNGGASWYRQYYAGNGSLYGSSSVDANKCWAVGTGGLVLATADGGASWEQQDSGTDAMLYNVSFANANDGWAVGESWDAAANAYVPVIIATTDGGTTWQRQSVPFSTGGLSDICFADADHGWAVGWGAAYDGVILATTDGGTTWVEQCVTAAPLNSVSFVNAEHGWACGEDGVILSTTTGGVVP